MNSEIYSFNVGAIRCKVVSDGTMTYAPPMFPPPAIFLCANAPAGELQSATNPHVCEVRDWKEWTSSYNCLFIDTGEHRVLVDTGAGALSPTTGRLVQNLKSAGIAPDDIDFVILTHAHPDHVGGAAASDGKPSFPRATWAMWRDEWEFWMSSRAEERLSGHSGQMLTSIAREKLFPVMNRIELVDLEREIVPGIRAVAAPGHTPGHMALDISCAGDRLFCASDLLLHPVHLAEPDWFAATDVIPASTIETRRNLLPRLAAERTKTMAFHFPFPGLGYVEATGATWDWKPI